MFPEIIWYDLEKEKLILAHGLGKRKGSYFLIGQKKIYPLSITKKKISLEKWLGKLPFFDKTPFCHYAYPSRSHFLQMVQRAQNELLDDEKVVLARSITFRYHESINPYQLIYHLLLQHKIKKRGTLFAYIPKPCEGWIGLTPETLFIQKNLSLQTESLAATAKEDLHLLQPKENLEQELVTRSIINGLDGYIKSLKSFSSIKQLPYASHLHTTLDLVLNKKIKTEHLIKLLHPTGALGGYPKQKALSLIEKYEPFQRDVYGSPIGWVWSPYHADLKVAIRCAHLNHTHLRAYAGAGILKASNPLWELSETDLKLSIWPCKK